MDAIGSLLDFVFHIDAHLATFVRAYGAWVYALLVPRPLNYFLFWGAWGLCLAAIFLYALRKTARAQQHLAALAAYGAVTWLPQYLRSPTQALFADELYHEARTHYGNDPAISALNDVITSFYSSISDK